MRAAALVLALAVTLSAPAARANTDGDCFVVHGRLRIGNGTPSVRIWPVGTHRLLGVPDTGGDEDLTNTPPNVREALGAHPFDTSVYGDFHVCAATRSRPHEMQLVRIESADITAVRR